MKKFLVIMAVSVLSFAACQKEPVFHNEISDNNNQSVMMSFSSTSDLAEYLELMKSNMGPETKTTLSIAVQQDTTGFISLRQYLINQGLRSFSDAELAEIVAEGLIYEPEDTIVPDIYLSSVLNAKREIEVSGKIYRYVEGGVLVYDNQVCESTEIDSVELSPQVVAGMTHGDHVLLPDNSSIEFIRIDNGPEIYLGDTDMPKNDGNNDGSEDDEVVYNYDGSITLTNGVKIPADRIRRVSYAQGNGDANGFQKFVSGLWGTNVVAENYFDKRHRMKLRMFNQDYIIYRSVGMTVRMQQRKFGIWWRKKAEEFRYGWSNIECEYVYDNPVFSGLPSASGYGKPKIPTAMLKKFPFQNDKVVLFHIPIVDYDLTTGDINALFNSSMKKLSANISNWFKDDENSTYRDNPRGLFSVTEDDKTMYVVYPQGEEFAYNEGREQVWWEFNWFSGNFVLSFSTNLSGSGQWATNLANFEQCTEVTIKRGRIYGAVKYDGEWRACIIETI